jgi:hypothetical protein
MNGNVIARPTKKAAGQSGDLSIPRQATPTERLRRPFVFLEFPIERATPLIVLPLEMRLS